MFNMGVGGIGSNGLCNMVAQSQMNADLIIEHLESCIKSGYTFEEALEHALKLTHYSYADLLPIDKERVDRKIESIMKSNKR